MKFFCEVLGDAITLTGEDAKHLIKSLRVRLGECVVVCDGRGFDYVCRVTAINSDTVELDVQEKQPSTAELSYSLVLYQCMPKGEKWDFILQKSVELGVTHIVPVMSKNCVARLTDSDFEKKRDRYEKIILSAAKQSGRGKIPTLGGLIGIEQAFDELCEKDFSIFCYEKGTEELRSAITGEKTPSSVGVLIGAEGGFCEDEVDYAIAKGLKAYSLGGRILRAETAAIATLSVVSMIL